MPMTRPDRPAAAALLLLPLALLACGTPGGGGADAGADGGGAAACDRPDAGETPINQCLSDVDAGTPYPWLTEVQNEEGETGREVARAAAGDCGLSCLSNACPDTCAIRCMVDIKGVELTDACSDCYGRIVLCTVGNCLPSCINDPQAKICKDCQREKGCTAAFESCSGLPPEDPE